jgi:hypothetical protein
MYDVLILVVVVIMHIHANPYYPINYRELVRI